MKHLSWEEIQKERAQGLCFNCDEKFTARHRCRSDYYQKVLFCRPNYNDFKHL